MPTLDLSHLKPVVDAAQHILILFPHTHDYDSLASGLSLKLSLESHGKNVTTAASTPITVEFNRLIGVDSVTTQIGSRNLVIVFPDQTEAVDKISYSIENGLLNLVVTPKPDAPEIDHTKLKFQPSMRAVDAAFLIGVDRISDLGALEPSVKEILTNSKVISVTRDLPAENYTTLQIYDPLASSLSEIIVSLLEALSLTLTADAATNLLSGLEKSTESFRSPKVTPTTFATAAHLMRRGARRHHDQISSESFPTGSIPQSVGTAEAEAETATTAAPPSDWLNPKVYNTPPLV